MLVKIKDKAHPFDGWLATIILTDQDKRGRYRVKEWINPESGKPFPCESVCWLAKEQIVRGKGELEKGAVPMVGRVEVAE